MLHCTIAMAIGNLTHQDRHWMTARPGNFDAFPPSSLLALSQALTGFRQKAKGVSMNQQNYTKALKAQRASCEDASGTARAGYERQVRADKAAKQSDVAAFKADKAIHRSDAAALKADHLKTKADRGL
jgi:hypothetical protein